MPRSGHVECVVRFRGGDFDTRKAAFEAHKQVGVRHGAVGHWIARSIDDPNDVVGVVEFTSRGGARGYLMDVDRVEVQRTVMIEGGPHNRTWEEAIYETIDHVAYR
jgi:hypothetical protein